MEQLVTIELFGQPYTFKADSEVSKAREVADTLVREVARVEAQQPGPPQQMTQLTILLLAALNIANENFELKVRNKFLLQNISERSTKLIRRLDAGLS